jgi:hypothetical protein
MVSFSRLGPASTSATPTHTAQPFPIFRNTNELEDSIKAMRKTLYSYTVAGCALAYMQLPHKAVAYWSP